MWNASAATVPRAVRWMAPVIGVALAMVLGPASSVHAVPLDLGAGVGVGVPVGVTALASAGLVRTGASSAGLRGLAAWGGAPGGGLAGSGLAGSGLAGSGLAGSGLAGSGLAGQWQPPVRPLRVTARFDPPEHPWLPGHRGVDLRTDEGVPVRAAGGGRVVFAGTLAGRGVVSIDHGVLRTTYEPVLASVEVGQSVRVGAPIGVIATGSGHCGGGQCLHLGLRRGRTYLDPMLLLGHTSTRLRPW